MAVVVGFKGVVDVKWLVWCEVDGVVRLVCVLWLLWCG